MTRQKTRTDNHSYPEYVRFAGLVVIARGLHPIPSRTRPLNPSAPMVLCPKAWKSRTPPGLPSAHFGSLLHEAFRESLTHHRSLCPALARGTKPFENWRGVEQPGSSSGS